MALVFDKGTVPAQTEAPKGGSFQYDKWYEDNKQTLLSKRAERYKNDPTYREAAIRRAKAQRERQKEKAVPADGATLMLSEVADQLGVSIWVLREWRRKNFFPEPVFRSNRLWFKPQQVAVLSTLKTFFDTHGARAPLSLQTELEATISMVYANW